MDPALILRAASLEAGIDVPPLPLPSLLGWLQSRTVTHTTGARRRTASGWLTMAVQASFGGNQGLASLSMRQCEAVLDEAGIEQVGRHYAKLYLEQLASLTGLTIHLSFVDGANNAYATLCGTGIAVDPVWLGRVALNPAIGPVGAAIIMAHEVGHLLDCRQPHPDVEGYADIMAGQLMRALGFDIGDGDGVFPYVMWCDACGQHGPWQTRRRRYRWGWFAQPL